MVTEDRVDIHSLEAATHAHRIVGPVGAMLLLTATAALATVPQIAGTPPTSATVGAAYAFAPQASDPDGDTLSFGISHRPAWATFDFSTGRLYGTPRATDAGDYGDIRIWVTDGSKFAGLGPFSITVGGLTTNHVPTIDGAPPAQITQGLRYWFVPNASDPDGDQLSFGISRKPSWTSFDAATGRLSGTPGAADLGPYDDIQVWVTDGAKFAGLGPFSIDVVASASGSATLSWQPPTMRIDGSPLTNLAGYRVLYGTSLGNYTNAIKISNPGVTSYVVEGLAAGTYYFVVVAFDSEGLESGYSNVAQKTISP